MHCILCNKVVFFSFSLVAILWTISDILYVSSDIKLMDSIILHRTSVNLIDRLLQQSCILQFLTGCLI